MHFPTLSVLTTLACATLSLAAPLNPPPIPAGVVDEIGNKLVPRDAPGVPPAESCPLVVALTSLATDVQPALEAVVKVVDGKVSVEIDTNELKTAVLKVTAVVASHVDNIKNAALVSVDEVHAQVVGKLLVQILSNVYTALNTVAGVPGLAHEALDPVVAEVTGQLFEVVVVVRNTVPSAVQLIVAGVTTLYHQVSHLSIAVIFEGLGVAAPIS